MTTLCPSCAAKNLEGADECVNCGADLRNTDQPRPASQIEQSVMRLPLSALNMTPVHAVAPTETLEVAVQTLARQRVSILEVVDNGQLVGVFTVRDLIDRVGPDYPQHMRSPVGQFMTPQPEVLPPDVPLTFAINKMDVGGYRHVPVVKDGSMLGVVAAGDVIQFLVDHSREQVATVGVTTSHGIESHANKPHV